MFFWSVHTFPSSRLSAPHLGRKWISQVLTHLVISRVVELLQRRHWKQGAELGPVAFEMFQDLVGIGDGVDLNEDAS